MPGFFPLLATPGLSKRAHSYYKTTDAFSAADGQVITETPYTPEYATTVFEQVPEDYEGTPPWYSLAEKKIKNPEGRLFLARFRSAYRYRTPTEAEIVAYANSVLIPQYGSLSGITSFLTAITGRQSVASQAASSLGTVRWLFDLDGPGTGPLDQVIPKDQLVPHGFDFYDGGTDVLFGGENMRTFGAEPKVVLPRAVASEMRLVYSEMLLVDFTESDEAVSGT